MSSIACLSSSQHYDSSFWERGLLFWISHPSCSRCKWAVSSEFPEAYWSINRRRYWKSNQCCLGRGRRIKFRVGRLLTSGKVFRFCGSGTRFCSLSFSASIRACCEWSSTFRGQCDIYRHGAHHSRRPAESGPDHSTFRWLRYCLAQPETLRVATRRKDHWQPSHRSLGLQAHPRNPRLS